MTCNVYVWCVCVCVVCVLCAHSLESTAHIAQMQLGTTECKCAQVRMLDDSLCVLLNVYCVLCVCEL